MTIGKVWKDGLRDEVEQKQREDREKTLDQQRVEARRAIDAIPGKISLAIGSCQDSIDLGLGYLAPYDVACGDADRCFDAARDHTGGLLRAQDLAGRALIVFEWCAANDLDCYLAPHRVPDSPFTEFNYTLRAKPR